MRETRNSLLIIKTVMKINIQPMNENIYIYIMPSVNISVYYLYPEPYLPFIVYAGLLRSKRIIGLSVLVLKILFRNQYISLYIVQCLFYMPISYKEIHSSVNVHIYGCWFGRQLYCMLLLLDLPLNPIVTFNTVLNAITNQCIPII